MVSFGVQATLTNKIDDARDKDNFDIIELIYSKNRETTNNHLSSSSSFILKRSFFRAKLGLDVCPKSSPSKFLTYFDRNRSSSLFNDESAPSGLYIVR